MGKDSLLRLKETLLFNKLKEKEKLEFNDNSLSTKVIDIVTVVSPLLVRIPENMPEFTLHDPNHSAKVVENMGKIIPSDVLLNLNSIEITLLILSGYLHDIGMTCSSSEKESIIKSDDEFEILFKSDLIKYEKYNYFKNNAEHRLATFIEDQIFTEYLRRKHVTRSANYIEQNLSSGKLFLSLNGIPFWKHLVKICDGHGEPVSSLSNLSKWPRHTLIGEKIINIQYLALILRLADILDLDPERTPKVVYEFVNPKDPISIIEWQKHRSVIGHSISHDKILFEAECSNAEVERAFKEFMSWIELERFETMNLLSNYSDDISKRYFLNLNEVIAKDRIRSDGSYISNDLKFQIDYQRVMDLLMGQKLYKNPTLALRELLQNSIDAIKIRTQLYLDKSESFEPNIQILLEDETLSIVDNGIGMDMKIFKNYFLQVGKSFYSSSDFYGRFSNVDVTSEFGIGVLSTFMIANSIIIESRREPENPLAPPKPILFEIPTAYSYSVQKQSNKSQIGTRITLNLKSKNLFKALSIQETLEELIPNPPFEINVQSFGDKTIYSGVKTKNIPKVNFEKIKKLSNIQQYKVQDFSQYAPPYTHKLIDIKFNSESTNGTIINDIEGNLSLVNSTSMNWRSGFNGKLTQRNFTIGSPVTIDDTEKFKLKPSDNIKNLFPDWTSYNSEINLTKSASLSITPDRTDLIEDEKYKRLKLIIENKILKELEIHFESIISKTSLEEFFSYTDFLISTGFIGIDLNKDGSNFSSSSEKFFKKYLTFPILEPNGTIIRKPIEEIAEKPTIGIVNQNWNDDYLSETIEVIQKFNITLIILPKMLYGAGDHRIDRVITGLLGNNRKYAEPHTILTTCMPKFEIKLIKVNYNHGKLKLYSDVEVISNNLKKKSRILFMPRQKQEIYPIFNASHKLIDFLIDNEGEYLSEIADNLRSKLSYDIQEIISRSLISIAERDEAFSKKAISYGFGSFEHKNYFELTSGIFDKDPNLLKNFQSLFDDYWKNCKKNKIIKSHKKMPTITTEDFLPYWK